LGRAGPARAVEPGDAELALVRPSQAGQQIDGSGLAGAVGTEQTEQLSGPDLQVETVNRTNVAEPFREPAGRNRSRGAYRGDGYLRPAFFMQG